MSVLDKYNDYFVEKFSNMPVGKYISIALVRKTESEAIFRTDPEEGICTEAINFGDKEQDHVMISKRKQTAVERRIGRELLRHYGAMDESCVFNYPGKDKGFCGKCVDCLLYGFAVGNSGSQKSRVLTSDAYSILAEQHIVSERTFNGPVEAGTMYLDDKKETSSALNADEYVRAGAHFVDIETLKDVTKEEFLYVLGNILRASRYGAISSRMGKMNNHVIGVYFSHSELPSNYELLKATLNNLDKVRYPLDTNRVIDAASRGALELSKTIYAPVKGVIKEELADLLQEVSDVYTSEEKTAQLLKTATEKNSLQ